MATCRAGETLTATPNISRWRQNQPELSSVECGHWEGLPGDGGRPTCTIWEFCATVLTISSAHCSGTKKSCIAFVEAQPIGSNLCTHNVKIIPEDRNWKGSVVVAVLYLLNSTLCPKTSEVLIYYFTNQCNPEESLSKSIFSVTGSLTQWYFDLQNWIVTATI